MKKCSITCFTLKTPSGTIMPNCSEWFAWRVKIAASVVYQKEWKELFKLGFKIVKVNMREV